MTLRDIDKLSKQIQKRKEFGGDNMLNTILKAIVLGIVLWIVYYLVGLIVAALALPAVVALIVGVLLALGFLIWLLRSFGISF